MGKYFFEALYGVNINRLKIETIFSFHSKSGDKRGIVDPCY